MCFESYGVEISFHFYGAAVCLYTVDYSFIEQQFFLNLLVRQCVYILMEHQ